MSSGDADVDDADVDVDGDAAPAPLLRVDVGDGYDAPSGVFLRQRR